tara:strand:- start:6364 stop:6744 length:381 start_codon:yes stop_codon:yes gene_type:complete
MSSLLKSDASSGEESAYDSIIDLMNQKEFRNLFDKYFNDYSEIKAIIMIMKSYQYLEALYIKTYKVSPSKKYMSAGIKRLISNNEMRRFLVDSTISFMKEEGDFQEIVDKNFNMKLSSIEMLCLKD